ncbi:enoyl-CoA hydratase/isomerase family protein [Aquabacter spiritensis]|uniref:Short chain enoyl-CoA hydratase n=1 Tax=Aquabacter spiritensis TaxID=933073 RepID=A0A4R3M0L8_9HYPH|nr:enoyl-CoA hydratase/isomerase family protein [Aquabacter spiritensis]TCT05709.1 short chain enoyl-CoA hydratase [Aquabacter spiritensis]
MDTESDGAIRIERDGPVARLVIDRPRKHNAITPEMARSLGAACAALDADDAVRVAVITGGGTRAFSAGSDMNALGEITDLWAFRNRVEYAAVVRDMRKPVIAALRGWVLGGGLEIALAADIRIAAADARLGAPEVTRGWVGGGGASQMLPRLVGYGQAMRLLLTGEPVDAIEALRIGLVEEVVPDADLEARVAALAARIAGFSPVATQAVKAATRAALSMPLEAGIRHENELHVICMSDRGRHEGIAAFQARKAGEDGN